MTVNDVDLVMQPTAANTGFITQPSDAHNRLTLHHFAVRDPLTAYVAPHNSDARRSDSDDWPPPLIFDVSYGCAALKTWGVRTFMDFTRTHTRHIYYNDGDNNGDENGDSGDDGQGGRSSQQIIDHDAWAAKRTAKRTAKRAATRAATRAAKQAKDSGPQASSTADSGAPDIADMVLSLWMHNARKVRRQADEMKAGRTREKVGTWLDSVE